MVKKGISAIIFLLIYLSSVFSLSTEDAVKKAIKEFENSINSTIVTGTGNFVYADKSIGSSYSLYLQELVSQELQISNKFDFTDRESLDLIMDEIKLGLMGITDESTSPEPGMLKGLESLVVGRFFDEGAEVRLFLELIDMESGLILEKVNYSIAKSTIPLSISILPDNYNDALYILDELSDLTNSSSEGLDVRAWSIRGDGGIYRKGENLVINFYTNRDCYIKVYHIDVNRKLSLIFPNPYYSDNFIKAERIYKIPDPRYPFSFTLEGPYGTEFIKVAASTVQFDDIEEAFSELGTASEELVSRGLAIKQTESLTAETMFSYTILE